MVQTRRKSAAAAAGPGGSGGEPEPFQVGFAISTWQNSGDQSKEASNWGIFERQRTWLGMSTIDNGDRCGESSDFWNRYEEDLTRAAQLGSNCFRISLEWHRIEPAQGSIDQAAVQRYCDMFECMRSKGMEPHVTLHHFVHPAWFERLGGFTKDENIPLFLEYARTCYTLFGKYSKYWATFNEPGVTSFAGHVYGSFPPGRLANVAGCARQMLCMFRSHAAVYKLIKSLPGGESAQVGIVWNYFWFEPKRSKWCTPFYLPWVSRVLNRLWGNDMFMTYMETGVFEWDPLPWVFSRVAARDPKPGCDFLGLNYYSRGVMDWKLSPSCNHGETMTDMPYALYPEGLTLAVHHMSQLGVPIYITETGVADVGDERRPVLIDTYMQQIEKTVAMGYDLRGIMYWTLVDNFEWGFGFSMRFGMFRWENDGSQKRIARKSAALLQRWYERLPGRVAELLRTRERRRGRDAVGEAAVEMELLPVWTPASFPDINGPGGPAACGRPGVDRTALCDPDGLLSAKSKDYVEGVINAITSGEPPYTQASCGDSMQGYQVAVAVMRSLLVPSGQAPGEAAAQFAKELHTRWGVGDKACNNGVLFLLSVDDRQVYINTGTGAARALGDDRIQDIVSDIRPQLRAQEYDAAVERAVVDIGLSLEGGHPKGDGSIDFFGVAFLGVFAFIFGNAAFKSLRKKRQHSECKKMLAKLKREQENLRSHAWSCPASCPICLEDFSVQPPWRGGNKDKGREEGSGDSAGPSGGGGIDAEAGPSTSLLHSSGAASDEEFARMSAAGRAAVRRLRQRRRGGDAGGSSGAGGSSSGWADGAGPSTAAATTSGGGDVGGGEPRKQRVPITLGCGHTFCTPCIETWLDKGTTCPVCRKPIADDSSEASSEELQSVQRQRIADDWLAADLAFRLGVLQTRYPAFITPSMVDTWSQEAASTGSFNWETNRDFQLTDPGARQHYQSSGHGGFSHSFGGGSGFGGGGGGGSW
ncbi:glycoside hydrolase [Micractinium conductrix]|uniref:Glycoside hydrolase n=1 Tax=Micractinium conductrix TaxID=554055 RepID=A0A2P6V9J1_9CHLO|nr:glycoside hydrolase [Micractinium conductrix]|eukprot:PSC70754.1 glycoside hydrolase [Micractinium conductrix]